MKLTGVFRCVGVTGAVALAAACSDTRAISTEPFGAPSYGVQIQKAATNLPRGQVRVSLHAAAPATDSFIVRIAGLDTLTTAGDYYTVWVSDTLATNFRRLTGEITVVHTDTVINPATGDPESRATRMTTSSTAAFKNGGPGDSIIVVGTRASIGLAPTDSMVQFLVTIEHSATATTPNPNRRPLFNRRSEISGGVSPLNFGFFSLKPESLYVYQPVGRGRVFVRGKALTSEDSSLSTPPRGYYYATWALRSRTTGTGTSATTVVDTIYLGPLRTPGPNRMSLVDADSVIVDAAVQTATPREIRAASIRTLADTVTTLSGVTPYKGFSDFIISLEVKGNVPTRLGPNVVFRAAFPSAVRSPAE